MSRLKWVFAIVLMVSSVPSLAQLASCPDIQRYWQSTPPTDIFAQIENLKSAVAYIGQNPAQCEPHDVERVRFSYAETLDRFSRTYPRDSDTAVAWAVEAARQYQNYLEWFLALDGDERDRIIVAVTGHNGSAPGFADFRRRWIRLRVGSVLNSLGGSYELAKSYATLVDTYAQIAGDCTQTGPDCIQIFPLEVVRKWHKWLRSMPDFALLRQDDEIRRLVRNNGDCSREWAAFRDFLNDYVPANPSVQAEWQPLQRKVSLWLEI